MQRDDQYLIWDSLDTGEIDFLLLTTATSWVQLCCCQQDLVNPLCTSVSMAESHNFKARLSPGPCKVAGYQWLGRASKLHNSCTQVGRLCLTTCGCRASCFRSSKYLSKQISQETVLVVFVEG